MHKFFQDYYNIFAPLLFLSILAINETTIFIDLIVHKNSESEAFNILKNGQIVAIIHYSICIISLIIIILFIQSYKKCKKLVIDKFRINSKAYFERAISSMTVENSPQDDESMSPNIIDDLKESSEEITERLNNFPCPLFIAHFEGFPVNDFDLNFIDRLVLQILTYTTTKPSFIDNVLGHNWIFCCGVIVLVIGNIISSILQICDYVIKEGSCYNAVFVVRKSMEVILILLEGYFLISISTVVINCFPKLFSLILVELILTNIFIYTRETTNEITRGLLTFQTLIRSNYSTTGIAHSQQHHTCENKFSAYLDLVFPCVSEFNLIAVASFAFMIQGIGHVTPPHDEQPTFQKPNDEKTVVSRKTLIMLICGMSTVVVTITYCIYYSLINDYRHIYDDTILTMTYDAISFSLMVFSFLSCFIVIRDSSYLHLPEKHVNLSNVNCILLLVGMVGSLAYDSYQISITIQDYYKNSIQLPQMTRQITHSVLDVLVSSFQLIVILDCVRRVCIPENENLNQRQRSSIFFLLLLNLSLWMINTFELKRSIQQQHLEMVNLITAMSASDAITESVYRVLCCYILIPLTVFYRFHCTMILGEIWHHLHKSDDSNKQHRKLDTAISFYQ